MLRRFLRRSRLRKAEEAIQELDGWNSVCGSIVRSCTETLADDSAGRGEIGAVLDRNDRALFALRDHAWASSVYLRRRHPELEARLRVLTDKTIELRNQTVRFLIRAQGPIPAFLDDPGRGAWGREAHAMKALAEVGLPARRLAAELQPAIAQLASEVRSVLEKQIADLQV